MPVKLIVTRKEDPSWKIENEFSQDVISIGRHNSNSLFLEDPEKVVSRHHAEIKRNGARYSVIDCGSANATYLNDQQLQPNLPAPITDGDIIKIGDFSLHFSEVAEVNDSTVVFDNPFREDAKAVIALLKEVRDKYNGQDAARRSGYLKQALQEAMLLTGLEVGDEVGQLLAGELGFQTAAGAVPPAAPAPVAEPPRVPVKDVVHQAPSSPAISKRADEVLRMLMEASISLTKSAAEFREEFVGISPLNAEDVLHSMTAESLNQELLNSGISETEARKRIDRVRGQVDELILHHEALSKAYRATVKESHKKLLESFDIFKLERTFAKDTFGIGKLQLSCKFLPYYVMRHTYNEIKHRIHQMLMEDHKMLDQTVFRPVFIYEYMQHIAGEVADYSDSQQF